MWGGGHEGLHTSACNNTNTTTACPWQHDARENVEDEGKRQKRQQTFFILFLFFTCFSLTSSHCSAE